MARPSKYQPAFAEQAAKLCKLGASDEQIAWFFDVTLADIALWAWQHEEFFQAITPNDERRRQWAEADRLSRSLVSAYRRARRVRNPTERIANSVRARMWAALKGKTSGACLSRLGYSLEDLRAHLERRFQQGMTWENYGKWHIDHIRPCASFDLTDAQQFAECWSLENLQPLWAAENVRKGARYVA
ncbi:hypothetical protein [Achromobacter ruhlandii]|uniref:hypothetical protein n=1 Tax=Achromobacter ruhlandii TaxID=72557 RepID=UPI001EEF12F4|nr:hypothetical protein [Achromobacter ruhlandii]